MVSLLLGKLLEEHYVDVADGKVSKAIAPTFDVA
jgi:hypothetical protein